MTKKVIFSGHVSGQIYASGHIPYGRKCILCPGETRFGTTLKHRQIFVANTVTIKENLWCMVRIHIQLTDSGRFHMKLIFGQRSDAWQCIDHLQGWSPCCWHWMDPNTAAAPRQPEFSRPDGKCCGAAMDTADMSTKLQQIYPTRSRMNCLLRVIQPRNQQLYYPFMLWQPCQRLQTQP